MKVHKFRTSRTEFAKFDRDAEEQEVQTLPHKKFNKK